MRNSKDDGPEVVRRDDGTLHASKAHGSVSLSMRVWSIMIVGCLGCSASHREIGVVATSDGGGRVASDARNKSDGGRDPSSASTNDGKVKDEPVEVVDVTKPNPAGLSDAEVDELAAGGPADEMKWLYPYENTVMPASVVAPLLMWNGDAGTDAVYVRIRSRALEYKTVLRPELATTEPLPGLKLGNALRAVIPEKYWALVVAKTQGKGDTLTVEVTERTNGQIHGPLALHFELAGSAFHGSVYYSTCNTQMANDLTAAGKVLRIRPDGHAEIVPDNTQSEGQCIGCHSVSADGSRLLAQWGPRTATGEGIFGSALSFQLGSDGSAQPPKGSPAGPLGSYGALYPDGSKYLSTYVPGPSSPMFNYGWIMSFAPPGQPVPGLPGLSIPALGMPATLYDVDTAEPVPDTGIPATAMMAMFSPDGTRLVFKDDAIDGGRGLATMDYDVRLHKAINYRVLYREPDPGGNTHPGWPFFLPNNQAVVFVRSDSPLFASGTPGTSAVIAGSSDSRSNLYIVDVATGTMSILAKAMGFSKPSDVETNATYLPFGDLDLHHNYFPTVSPAAAGGYFWVFFDSMRIYGTFGARRALMGLALDIRGEGGYTTDPSHPPFHLIGQEELMFVGNNHRAFAALDKCRPEDTFCDQGIDCCSGRCSSGGLCVPSNGECAKTDEGCRKDKDCCPPEGDAPANLCIAGFCSYVNAI